MSKKGRNFFWTSKKFLVVNWISKASGKKSVPNFIKNGRFFGRIAKLFAKIYEHFVSKNFKSCSNLAKKTTFVEKIPPHFLVNQWADNPWQFENYTPITHNFMVFACFWFRDRNCLNIVSPPVCLLVHIPWCVYLVCSHILQYSGRICLGCVWWVYLGAKFKTRVGWALHKKQRIQHSLRSEKYKKYVPWSSLWVEKFHGMGQAEILKPESAMRQVGRYICPASHTTTCDF